MLAWILIVIGLVIVLYFVKQYCQLVSKRESFKLAFLQLEKQLMHRYQLLASLLKHIDDPKILNSLNLAHQSAIQATELAKVSIGDAVAIAELITAEALLTDLLEQMWQQQLESKNPSISSLRKEISENVVRVNKAKQAYNQKIELYNQFRLPQPNKLIANFYRFNHAAPFGS